MQMFLLFYLMLVSKYLAFLPPDGIFLKLIIFVLGVLDSLVYFDIHKNTEISEFVSCNKKTGECTLLTTLDGYTKKESLSIYHDIRDYLCDIGRIGDMFQATSTNDITFWLLHPNMERLWHMIRLNVEKQIISFDETWSDDEITCTGHRSTDVTAFKNLVDTKDTCYTNAELYTILHPNEDSLPFIYDNFRFHHCEFLGK